MKYIKPIFSYELMLPNSNIASDEYANCFVCYGPESRGSTATGAEKELPEGAKVMSWNCTMPDQAGTFCSPYTG